MPTEELPSQSVDTAPQIDESNKKVLDALDMSDPKGEQLKKVAAELATPEFFSKIQDATKATIHNRALLIMSAGGPNNERERLILQLQAKLFPSIALNMKLEQTAKPSESLKGIMKPDGTVDTEALKNLSPDKIREKIGKLNKSDIQTLIKALESMSDGQLQKVIMQVVTPFVETMVQNGFSLENATDVDFLEKNGGEKTKQAIVAWKKTAGEDPFKAGNKFIIKGEKILPLKNDKGELTAAGIDISKINTVDPKAGAEQLKKQLPPTFDKAKFGDMIAGLLKSDSKIFKGLGEILKIFAALLGIDITEKGTTITEALNPKQKRGLLAGMLNSNGAYDITNFFDAATGNITGKSEDPKFQLYLTDIDKILGPGVVKKSTDGKSLVYDESATKAITDFQKAFKIDPPTGKLDSKSIPKILDKMDASGKIIETTIVQPAAAPAPQPAPAAPAVADKAPETPKHTYSDLYKGLEGKTSYEEIKKDPQAVKLIQDTVGVKEATYGPLTRKAVGRFQLDKLGMQNTNKALDTYADGFFGPKTIAILKAKIDKETAEPKK